MKPIITTLAMGLVAVASIAVAAAFYPWPELASVSAEVGKPLFEPYETDNVRSIQIMEYNEATSRVEQLKLRRKGNRWLLPGSSNYNATNSPQLALVANSLMDREILELKSDNQLDHGEYGVVDPREFTESQNTESVGKRLVLEDRNGKSIASVIVGKTIKRNPTMRFVRRVGQPHIFVVDFAPLGGQLPEIEQILSANFKSWIDPNLFQLRVQNNESGFQLESLEVENYRIDPTNLKDAVPDPKYQVKLSANSGQLQFDNFEIAKDGKLVKAPEGAQTEQMSQFVKIFPVLPRFFYQQVLKKEPALGKELLTPSESADPKLFSTMERYGFRKSGFDFGTHQFQSAGGRVIINTREGLKLYVSIGSIAGLVPGQATKSAYFVLCNAGVDLSGFPKPEPIADDASDEEKKEYARALKKQKTNADRARRQANEFNKQVADWYFIVDEDTLNAIRPRLAMLESSVSNADEAEENPAAGTDEQNEESAEENEEAEERSTDASPTKDGSGDDEQAKDKPESETAKEGGE